ncbi:hypothetical protein GOP47_0027519 [Adiantum capillus-veneris]|nr:hypothetical protein GOP47_0027519 [Adiantum capillus-veneris]
MMPIQVKASGYKYGCTGSDWAAWQGGTLLGKQLEDDESEVGESARSGRPARDVEHCEQRIVKGRGSLQEEGRWRRDRKRRDSLFICCSFLAGDTA